MTEVTSYTREECLPLYISPTGVKYDVYRDAEVDLYEIRPVIEDEDGNKKADYRREQIVKGQFTSLARAFGALHKALIVQWDASDAKAEKNASRRVA